MQTTTQRLKAITPAADDAAFTSDTVAEAYEYAISLQRAYSHSQTRIQGTMVTWDFHDVYDYIADCLHAGGLTNDWLCLTLEDFILTVEYGDHKPIHVDYTPGEYIMKPMGVALEDLAHQAINRLEHAIELHKKAVTDSVS